MSSIDELMTSFVLWHGEVPLEGKRRIHDGVARAHASPWIRRNIGKGIVQSYVIGFSFDSMWWTYFFDRTPRAELQSAQSWRIEAYNNHGPSWIDTYFYWPSDGRWRHSQYVIRGDNFGRHITPMVSRTGRELVANFYLVLTIAGDVTQSSNPA